MSIVTANQTKAHIYMYLAYVISEASVNDTVILDPEVRVDEKSQKVIKIAKELDADDLFKKADRMNLVPYDSLPFDLHRADFNVVVPDCIISGSSLNLISMVVAPVNHSSDTVTFPPPPPPWFFTGKSTVFNVHNYVCAFDLLGVNITTFDPGGNRRHSPTLTVAHLAHHKIFEFLLLLFSFSLPDVVVALPTFESCTVVFDPGGALKAAYKSAESRTPNNQRFQKFHFRFALSPPCSCDSPKVSSPPATVPPGLSSVDTLGQRKVRVWNHGLQSQNEVDFLTSVTCTS